MSKVVVLSPTEWDNRVQLKEILDEGYDHLHKSLGIESAIQAKLKWLMLESGRGTLDPKELRENLARISDLSNGMSMEVRDAQSTIWPVVKTIMEDAEQ